MSNGMYCSASHRIDSARSSSSISGRVTFLTITAFPDTAVATRLVLMPFRSNA